MLSRNKDQVTSGHVTQLLPCPLLIHQLMQNFSHSTLKHIYAYILYTHIYTLSYEELPQFNATVLPPHPLLI